jgi:hypothetical protein
MIYQPGQEFQASIWRNAPLYVDLPEIFGQLTSI